MIKVTAELGLSVLTEMVNTFGEPSLTAIVGSVICVPILLLKKLLIISAFNTPHLTSISLVAIFSPFTEAVISVVSKVFVLAVPPLIKLKTRSKEA